MRFLFILISLGLILAASLANSPWFLPVSLALLSAIGLILAAVPSFSLRQETSSASPDLDDNHVERQGKKAEMLKQLIAAAEERIWQVVGEFNPPVFTSRAVAEELKRAAERGVDIQIVMGDRGRRTTEELSKDLWETNREFLEVINPYVEQGWIKLFCGPREVEHFIILDRNVIVEQTHAPGISNTWHYKKNTWILAEQMGNRFREITRTKQVFSLT